MNYINSISVIDVAIKLQLQSPQQKMTGTIFKLLLAEPFHLKRSFDHPGTISY